jgi:myosin-5
VNGDDHTILVDDDNNAYVFGDNRSGQLGIGHSWVIEKPLLLNELKGKIKEIRSSGDKNIALTIDNELYIWPLLFTKNAFKPTRMFMDRKIIISSISCGKNFAMILSKQGIVYAFGIKNKYGELGTGDYNPRNTPEQIYSLSDKGDKITQISCGYKHVVAKNSIGKVFAWGCVCFI